MSEDTNPAPLTRDDVRAIAREEIRRRDVQLLRELGFECDETRLEESDGLNQLHVDVDQGGRVASARMLEAHLLKGLYEAIRDLQVVGKVRDRRVELGDQMGVRDGVHEASPSVDGSGELTVGDGQVAGGAYTSPAADATLDPSTGKGSAS